MTNAVDTPTDEPIVLEAINKFIPELLHNKSSDHCPDANSLKQDIAQCAQMGFIDAHISTRLNGLGLSSRIQWEIIRQLSRHNPGFALSYLAHSILITQNVIVHNQEPKNTSILQQLRRGEALGCCAISEPGAGSDVMSMKTTALSCAGGYILTGEKTWITNAPYADYALVYAKLTTSKSRDLGVFLVNCQQESVQKSKPLEKIGMHSSPTGTIYFQQTFVPEHNRIDRGNAKAILFEQLHFERLMLSAGPVGIMDYVFNKTLQYTKLREQFNKPLNKHGQIQAILANMWTSYHSSIALCEKALQHQHKLGRIPPQWASGSYLHAAEAAVKLCEDAIQCHGANGYIPQTKLGQYWQDAKLYTIGGGTSEIRRSIISQNI